MNVDELSTLAAEPMTQATATLYGVLGVVGCVVTAAGLMRVQTAVRGGGWMGALIRLAVGLALVGLPVIAGDISH